MKIAIMQPYFFPYIGYFQLLNIVDLFVFYDDVNYIKKGWVNRNKLIIGGQEKYFNLNLIKASQNKKINEIKICEDEKWRDSLIKTFEYNYKKYDNYEECFNLLEHILYYSYNLEITTSESIIKSAELINIHTEVKFSSEIEYDRNKKGQDKILELCRCCGATEYINPIGGISLYDMKLFLDNNINLKFIKTEATKEDLLSILHVICTKDKEYILKLLNKYKLM